MNRRSVIGSLAFLGAASCLGLNKLLFKDSGKTVHCNIEDFWDTVEYQEEKIDGVLQRNIYRIEDYPTCSCFKKIPFEDIRKGDYFIIVRSKYDYMGPNTGYGYVSNASSEVFGTGSTLGVMSTYINMKRCWTEEAFEKHMISSGADYHSPSGHYKNGIKIG